MSRKKRPLNRKDLRLWQKVAQTVQPMENKAAELKALIESLSVKAPSTSLEGEPSEAETKRMLASEEDLKALKEGGISSSRPRSSMQTPPLNSLDRREKKRVRQGRLPIEARLDLHGMTQAQAHSALSGFLRSSQAQGFKHVLVITGKGSRGDSDPYAHGESRGILRRVVPKWLSDPEIRPLVVGFEEAHRSLGGTGALHIRLRAKSRHKPAK